MEEIITDINAMLDGKMKANKACEEAQQWLKITCYLLASEVANNPTKEERKASIERIKKNEPLFYDDVKTLAKKIFKEKSK